MGRKLWRGCRCLVPGAVAILAGVLLARLPGVTERVFSRGIFRGLAAVLGTLTQYLPFSVAECLVVAALPAVAVVAVLLVRAIRRNGRQVWRRVGQVTGWTLSAVLVLYMLMHGYNYSRVPLAQQMALPQATENTEELTALCRYLAQQASAARESCAEDTDGCMARTASLADTLHAGGEGYTVLARDYPFLHGTVHRVKAVRLSHWWSYTGITGVYFPLLAEANVNIDIPDTELPMTIAHELAHTRGFAHEDECNFLGILACVNHPSADWQYSGWLSAYVYASNTLYETDLTAWRTVRESCSEGVQRDLRRRSEYWKGFQGQVMEVSDRANSAFIQANGDAEGTARYGEVTLLLLAWRESMQNTT